MKEISEETWSRFKWMTDDHECDERCTGEDYKNPVAKPSDQCICGHWEGAHWKGKACRAYACCCGKFTPS